MIPDDQIRREIAYLDDPDAYTNREEFLAAVLVRSPQRLREILAEPEPCEDCAVLEEEIQRLRRRQTVFLVALAIAGAAVALWRMRG